MSKMTRDNLCIVLVGAQGAGKGTVTKSIQEIYESNGNKIKEVGASSFLKLSEECIKYIDNGELVPDNIVNNTIINGIKEIKGDFILDGFPRTINQAKELKKLVEEQGMKIIIWHLKGVSDDKLIKRISGRIVCPECGATYNKYNKQFAPKVEGLCNKCKVELSSRADDTPEKVAKRLKDFHTQTEPAAEWLKANGFVALDIDAEKLGIEDAKQYLLQTEELLSSTNKTSEKIAV